MPSRDQATAPSGAARLRNASPEPREILDAPAVRALVDAGFVVVANGGGGMGPPLSNPVWVYGNDGDTLFRLIALGSDGLQAQGYARKGSENVVGPMPPHGNIVKSNDDMWKIIGWIWSINPPDKSASAAQ